MSVIPADYKTPKMVVFDGSKAERVLGLKYRPIEETVRDTAAWMYEYVANEDKAQ